MKVVTKRYQLEPSKYIGLATKALIRKEKLYALIPIALLIAAFVVPGGFWWFLISAILVPGLYLLFWWIQFAGITQHEAGKMFFMKMNYELDGRQFLMKVDAKTGMPIDWKQFKKCHKTKDAYILTLSKAQFVYLPFDIFKNDNDKKLAETIFKRKNLL